MKFSLLSILLLASIEVLADDYGLSSNEINIQRGGSSSLDVFLTNSETISALQFDLLLPEGITIEEYSKGNRCSSSQTISVKALTDSTYRVLISSSDNSNFKETADLKSESIARFKLAVPLGYACGEYKTRLNNIILSHFDSSSKTSWPYYVDNQIIKTTVLPADSFLLSYLVDNELYYSVSVEYGTPLTCIDSPEKEGYTFSGWSDIPVTMPANDVEVVGTFSANIYALTYKVDGVVYHTDSIACSSIITSIDNPVKEGYTFSGWGGLPATMPANDVEVSGAFSINSYILTYKVDGVEYRKDTLIYNTTITPLAALTKEGYTFSGWSEIPSTMPASDVEITGTFSVNSYSLVYKVDGETYKTVTLNFGSSITAEPEPAKVGYTFSGWSEIPATMPANNVEITGTFSINSYILTYKVDTTTYKVDTLNYATAIKPLEGPTKEGYTFSGWSEIPVTMPANNVEITGTFNINSYSLVYKVDGEIYKTMSLDYGSSITAEPEPTKVGYAFSGWSEIPATMPASDVEVTGTFSINSYILVYKVDGTTYKSLSVVYGSEITAEIAPTKEGYTFSGWSEIPSTMPANDVEITGTFSINSYRLVYKVDGTTYKSLSVVYGSEITAEIAPTKEGYTFSGWSEIPSTMPANDVEITGAFSINSYNLVYKVDGTIYKSSSVVYGSEITPEVVPVKEGYTFSGWSEIPSKMPSRDVEITGIFSVNSYNLVYKVDGDTYKTFTVEYGSSITTEPDPTKEGFTFSGWSDSPSTMPARDVEINGTFSVNSYRLVYKVDGATYKSLSVVYGSEITAEIAPTKEGYTFSGWSEIPSTMPAKDVEVTGTFSVNSYNLVYKVDDETYKTMSLNYGSSITAEPDPVKEGYTFSGWSDIPATMPANDVEITGTFRINSYRLVYKVDGTMYKSSSIVYGSDITALQTPVREGYTFSGWSEIPATMPAKDVEITGTFSINSYNLVYKVDGETYKTISLDYGSSITSEAELTKEGYTFSGWSEIPATMPASDVEVTGAFSINSYRLVYKVDGTTYKSLSVIYGSEITPEVAPVKEGYTFSGWSEIPSTMPASDVEIGGTLNINSYKLVYIVDGETYKSLTVEYGSSITAESEPTREGSTFSGWSGVPSTMPARDVEITGSFDSNSYKLIYKLDGEIYKSSIVKYESDITAEPDPVKEGYTFSGWSDIPVTMPASDVEITGTFSVNSYNLVYKVDDKIYKTMSMYYGSSITAEPEPTKEGSTFSGWSDIPVTMPASDVEITGTFSVNSYRLVYKVDGATYKSLSVVYGNEITAESAPVKEGYTFSGWSDIPVTMPASDVEITGTFSVNSYNLVYKVDGKTYKTMSLYYGSSITAEPEPTKEGNTFSGWSDIPVTMPASDVEITGTFSANSYRLVYKVDGATYKSLSVIYGSQITAETAPTREGSTFSGWSDIPATMPANDVEITGTFSVNSYNLVYKVDGEIYKSLSVEYGSSITPEPDPTKEGSTFSGWSGIPSIMPARDVEITGSFDSNSYKLVYKLDGEIYKSSIVIYGSEITAEPAPVKEGYTFSGWSEIPETMPANDVEITGTFSINSYKLVYKVDGETYKIMSLYYGSSITAEPEPKKEGRTFSGWSDIPATMPANDVEITGSFDSNSYKLVYMLDGVLYKSSIVTFGDSIIAEPTPTKEGYTFSGWSEIPATMPANDVEVTGTFSINSYILTYKVDGVDYKKDTLEYNTAITPLAALAKEGYTFSGWSEIPAVMPANDVEVNGKFNINKYLLKVLIDGEVVYSDSILFGTKLADYVNLITSLGIDLSQWVLYDQIETITMPAHDVTINAVLDEIMPVLMDMEKTIIYDMTGKRIEAYDINTLPAGSYIINGKKYKIMR